MSNSKLKTTLFVTVSFLLLQSCGVVMKKMYGIKNPEIENEHWIIDIGAAKMADTPEAFDVIVMPNLYGDVLSDVAAQITGSVGLAGSANIGETCAMFEAIHGSAPRRAGQNLANPSGLLQGAILMLQHLGQNKIAEKIQNAWLKTMEDGVHTYDIFKEGTSKVKVGTKEFAQAVIDRLGQKPTQFKPVAFAENAQMNLPKYQRKTPKAKSLEGVDLFVHWPGTNANELAKMVQKINLEHVQLAMITNRGIKVWPEGFEETFCTDHWRCRFKPTNGASISSADILTLMNHALQKGVEIIKTENLYAFEGVAAYSLGQGQ